MPRLKGLPKTGGRKKGTPNKPKLPVSRAVPGNMVVVTTHEALGKLGGSRSEAWNDVIALQVVNALWLKDPAARHKQAGAMLVGLNGISPRDELEGMMVAQLITAHNAVMDCYRRAAIPEQHAEARRENLAQAGKLSRTFAMLLEALNRHRGKGQQKVTVEHVHVS
jgi:hypothetical protein